MLRNWMRLAAASTLALAMVVAGCDTLGEPSRDLLGPSTATHTDGTATGKYKILKGIYGEKVRENSQVIQPTAGGDVGVAGNVLIVPKGAVDKPTLFTMTLSSSSSDGSSKLQVKLSAYQQDSKGDYKIEVGSKGFLKPLKLRMDYSWTTDPIDDPNQLRIVWLKPDGTQNVYTTEIDASKKTTSTWLDHFSEYGIGWPL